MQNEIATLVEDIKADYLAFTSNNGTADLSPINIQMIAEFNDNIEIRKGRKYIKIVSNNSVWGFIVNTDTDAKFKEGDILKAAGFNTPARNSARGNIIEGDYSIAWTGPHYL